MKELFVLALYGFSQAPVKELFALSNVEVQSLSRTNKVASSSNDDALPFEVN